MSSRDYKKDIVEGFMPAPGTFSPEEWAELREIMTPVNVRGPSGEWFVPSVAYAAKWPFPIDVGAVMSAIDEDASGRNM